MIFHRLTALLYLCCSLPLAAALDFSTAAQRVFAYSLSIKSSEIDLYVREAEAWQAWLYPNPSLYVQYDSFGGNHSYRGWNASNSSITLSQVFLTAGKRGLAYDTASAHACSAAWDLEIQKLDLLEDLSKAFIDAVLAQEKLALAEQQFKIAQDTQQNLIGKRESGKATVLELKKGEIALHTTKIALDKARTTLITAKCKIASLWGDCEPDFQDVSYALSNIIEPPAFGCLQQQIENAPELAKAQSDRWTAHKAKQLELARRIPDVDVSAGVYVCNHWDDYSFSLALTVPLPVFDRNQGNIRRAQWLEWQSIYNLETQKAEQTRKLETCYKQWLEVYQEAKTLQELSTKAAQDALAQVQMDFNQGKSNSDDLLEAQKLVLDVQSDFLDAAAEFHRTKTDVLRLIAGLYVACGGLDG